ncbi:MAG: aminoacyl-histidine dipeptidase [Lachnospiraceae bacterium]|nr:aminoacyl-histidine dipeptidase [Lachnospiraceae bacterium]
MGVLDHLEPHKVFHYFEEISRIPHGSHNIRQISDYLKQFALDRGLACIQDELYNIIIIKEATAGYEQEEPIILQGHMDMVAVSGPDCDIDMAKDPLQLYIEDNRIRAKGTSLGGDDGVAVAYVLALLDAQDISHPRLEVILTVDEETGMEGAGGIDLSLLRGKRLINLDQEEEGVIITSCAGGAGVDVSIPMRPASADRKDVQMIVLKILGLHGGHSGTEIHKGRGNANCLLGRILKGMSEKFPFRMVMMRGGQADNAIPRESEAVILVDINYTDEVLAFVREEEANIRQELGDRDAGFSVESNVRKLQEDTIKCYDEASTLQAVDCICKQPNGVIAMSTDLEGLVQTSLNLGVITLEQDVLKLSYAVRSCVDEDKENLCRQMTDTAMQLGASIEIKNSYPGWIYRKESPLRDIVAAVYEEMYGKKPVFEAIHAGLECGILAAKIPGLDCVSMGPDMSNVHTVEESLDIASVQRTWEFLKSVLARR